MYVISDETPSETASAIVHDIHSRLGSVGTLSGIEWAKNIDRVTNSASDSKLAVSKTSADFDEEKSGSTLFEVVDAFIADFSTNLDTVSPSLTFPSSLVASTAVDTIDKLLTAALEKSYKTNEATFSQYSQSRTMVMASYVARTRVAASLRPVHRRLMEAVASTAVDTFDLAVRKVSPDARLPQRLRNAAALCQKQYLAKSNLYKKGY